MDFTFHSKYFVLLIFKSRKTVKAKYFLSDYLLNHVHCVFNMLEQLKSELFFRLFDFCTILFFYIKVKSISVLFKCTFKYIILYFLILTILMKGGEKFCDTCEG